MGTGCRRAARRTPVWHALQGHTDPFFVGGRELSLEFLWARRPKIEAVRPTVENQGPETGWKNLWVNSQMVRDVSMILISLAARSSLAKREGP